MSSRFERASVLLDQHRYDLAARELLEGLAQDPNNVWAHCALALCRSYEGQHAAAHDLARRAIELAPHDADGYVRLAWTILRNPDYRPPGLPWESALRRVWWALVASGRMFRRLEEVERLTREALRLDPRELRAHGMLAGVLLAQSKPREALEAAERGLAVDPDHEAIRNMRARALMEVGRASEASDAARSTLAIHPESPDTHAVRGRALLLQGRSPEAAEHILQSLRIDPNDGPTRDDLLEAMKTRPWLFRCARLLYVPYARPATVSAKYACAWVWCAACIFVASVTSGPEGQRTTPAYAAVAALAVVVGVFLPAALLMMRHVGAYAFHLGSYGGGADLVLFQERLMNRLTAFAAGIIVGATGAWFTGSPSVEFLLVAALAALPVSAAGAAGDAEGRRRLTIYAAAFAIAAALIALTAPGFAAPFRSAFLATGVLGTLPPLAFAWGRAREPAIAGVLE
jgi:tetratricopeptide (TPR) repeat protein